MLKLIACVRACVRACDATSEMGHYGWRRQYAENNVRKGNKCEQVRIAILYLERGSIAFS